MIEWAKAGREILARNQHINPSERAAMIAQIEAVDAAGKTFKREEALMFDLPGRDPETVNEAFAARYPNYATDFSDDLKATLAIDAPLEARRLNHNYVGTAYLFLSLLNEGSPAKSILEDLGIDLAKTRKAVEFSIGRGEITLAGNIGLTQQAQAAIEIAVREAKRLKHQVVTGEHLLLSLTWESASIAVDVLESAGISIDRVRQAVMTVQS